MRLQVREVMPTMKLMRSCGPSGTLMGVLGLFLLAAPACTNLDDTGTLCGNPNLRYAVQPVGGETGVVGITRFDRDALCQTFQCLSLEGYAPYCTRSCKVLPALKNADSCKNDLDCEIGLRCNAGVCAGDDCPPGFACTQPLNLGSYVGKRFCTRVTTCNKTKGGATLPTNGSDLKCQDVGTVACTPVACYDSCPQADPSGTCSFHNRICRPQADMDCTCTSTPCTQEFLTCRPKDDTGQVWAKGSFTPDAACLPK